MLHWCSNRSHDCLILEYKLLVTLQTELVQTDRGHLHIYILHNDLFNSFHIRNLVLSLLSTLT